MRNHASNLGHTPELFDEAIAACTVVAEDHARTGRETKTTLSRHLAQIAPDLERMLEHQAILDALWDFTSGLAELISDRKNSIGSFIIRNSYRPAMFRQQFETIIGNPPWLSYRYIADPDYQQEIKRRAVEQYKIAPKSQKLFTQMELATVFLAHSMAIFAGPGAKLGFVMPRSILTADQHQKLIKRDYQSPFRITSYWDLWEVKPLFNVPACVLFARRDTDHGSPKDSLPTQLWSGRLPDRNVPWRVAREKLRWKEATARVIYLAQRCALSTEPGATTPTKPSKYERAFKQGATIVPRNFYFVRIPDFNGKVDPTALYWAETDPEGAVQAKPPYKDTRLSGLVEGRFIYSVVIARHLMPFAVLEPATAVLPVEAKHGLLHVRSAEVLTVGGYREFGKWMAEAERIWREKREEKAGKQTLYERLDYQRELTWQNLSHRHLVLYNAPGTNVSAAYFDREAHALSLIVEHTVYSAAFADRSEADFIIAILNSETANEAIKPFQATGLLGERHIEKKLLDLPIPIYNPNAGEHRKLAEFGEQARREAAAIVKSPGFPAASSLARQRAFVRQNLKGTLAEIDRLVRGIL